MCSFERVDWPNWQGPRESRYIDFPIETSDPNISGGFVPFPYSLCVFVYFASSCLVKI